MTDGRHRQPAVDKTPHTIPKDTAVLAAPRKRAMPESPHLESKYMQRVLVHGHPVISDVSPHHRLQPLALFENGLVHAPPKFGFHRIQLGLQPLANRLPQHGKHSVAPLLHADMREAQEVERLRLPFSAPLPVVDRKRTKLQQSRFLGMQLQVELLHSFLEFCPELIGIRFILEPNDGVIRESHNDHVSVRSFPPPRLGPQIEYIMEINVSQQGRCYSSNAKDNLASGRVRKGKSPSAVAHWKQCRLAESGSNDG